MDMINQNNKKMKKKKTILMLSALAALCFSACSNNHDEVSVNGSAVRFTGGIGGEAVAPPQSRAAGKEWHDGDEIGIFMVNNGTTDIAQAAENRQYTTGGDGLFTAVNGVENEIFYPMNSNTAVDFIAYYPYAEGANLIDALPVTISTYQDDASQRATDLMWAKATNSGTGYTKDNGSRVNFTFRHCLAKLTMNCTVHSSVGDASQLDGALVTIHGMNISSTFDLKAGKLSGTTDTEKVIVPRKLDIAPTRFHGAYDAIILPATYDAGKLEVGFLIDGEPFTWHVEAVTFEPGNEYIYNVNITRTKVTATCTIKPWNNTNKDNITAE